MESYNIGLILHMFDALLKPRYNPNILTQSVEETLRGGPSARTGLNPKFSRMKNFQEAYLRSNSKSTPEEKRNEVAPIAQAIVTALRAHDFFTPDDPSKTEAFLLGQLYLHWLKDNAQTPTTFKLKIRQKYARARFTREYDDCLAELLADALSRDNREAAPLTAEWANGLRAEYGTFETEPGEKEIPEEKRREQEGIAKAVAEACFPHAHGKILSLRDLAQNKLGKATLQKDRGDDKVRQLNQRHGWHYELPLNKPEKFLLFEALQNSCAEDEDILYPQMRVEVVPGTGLDTLLEGFPALRDNWQTLLDSEKLKSEQAGYQPESYMKTHAETWEIGDMDAGNHRQIGFRLKVSGFPYFDHCIFRQYFNGQYNRDIPGAQKEFERLRKIYVPDDSDMTSVGSPTPTKLFFSIMGCGVWVLSSDDYLMVSLRGRVNELSGRIGYTAAGSCEFTDRLREDAKKKGHVSGGPEALEAHPFLTASRELWEECNVEAGPEELRLISAGLDYERYLTQFSFFHRSRLSATALCDRSTRAASKNEQILFAVPFRPETVVRLIETYQMEPGAVVSLLNLCRRLRPNSFTERADTSG